MSKILTTKLRIKRYLQYIKILILSYFSVKFKIIKFINPFSFIINSMIGNKWRGYMRKNQLYYLIYPIIYFIIATVGQYFTSGNIRWRENLSLTVIAIVIVFLAFVIFNWANLPHASKSKSK